MRLRICFLPFIASTSLLWAQAQNSNQPLPAIELKRIPANAEPKAIPPLLQQYDFGAQIRALEQPQAIAPPPGIAAEIASNKAAPSTAAVPKIIIQQPMCH